MKQKIAILGSTGSIGKSTIDIIKKDKAKFDVVLLTANKNYNKLMKQAKVLNVNNLIIHDTNKYLKLLKKHKFKKIKIFNTTKEFTKFYSGKIDYCMSAITGIAGLESTLHAISFSKKIAIANKESIICAWNLIKKELTKHKTNFIPVDSEHFSVYELINGFDTSDVEEVILTASGGPFINLPLNKHKMVKPKDAIKHPKWKMGKKISVDSATLMNKVFEIIEAKKIFNLKYNQIKILIHPSSYIHALVKFKNGITKILLHDTDMKIPIFNSIYDKNHRILKTKKIDLNQLNNLSMKNIDKKQFPSINLIKGLPISDSLFETAMIASNDELVSLFLDKKISFPDIIRYQKIMLKKRDISKLKNKSPNNVSEIINLSKLVRLKIRSLCI
jgi:1-deoxy-D-xylulose-5-phosphate reductoisomerase